ILYEASSQDFNFALRQADRPVRVAVNEPGRQWYFANEGDDQAGPFQRWEWWFRNQQTGSMIPAPDFTKDDNNLTIDESIYGILDEGRYYVVCKAFDAADSPFESITSEQLSFVIDKTPPTLEIVGDVRTVGGVRQALFLPGEAPKTLELQASDQWASERNLQFLEIVDDFPEPMDDSVVRIVWRRPGAGQRFLARNRVFHVRDRGALPEYRRSDPVRLDVYSVSEDGVNLLEDWKALDQEIDARPEAYARTLQLIPLDELAGVLDDSGGINRQWLEANVMDLAAWANLEETYEDRKRLRDYDDQFVESADLYRRIYAGFDASQKERVDQLLSQLVDDWQFNNDRRLSPDDHLEMLRRELLVPVPDDGSAFEADRNQTRPLDSAIQIRPNFARLFGSSTRYRYRVQSEDPSGSDLQRLLEENSRVAAQGIFRPEGLELTKRQFLVIQTFLRDSESGQDFYSTASVFRIEPLVRVEEEAVRKLQDFAELATATRDDTEDTFARTAAWLDQEAFPFLVAGAGGDVEWLIENHNRSEEMDRLGSALDDLDRYRAGDQTFSREREDWISGATNGWDSSHLRSVERLLSRDWIAQSAGADPASFAQSAIEDYRGDNARTLLARPSISGEIALAGDGDDPILSRASLDSIDNLFFGWGTDGENPGIESGSWRAEESGETIALEPLPAGFSSYVLAVRFERQEGDLTISSPWVRLSQYSAGISLEEASRFMPTILAALPKEGDEGDESMFNDFRGLFKSAEASPDNSAILEKFGGGGNRVAELTREMVSEG
ncbi:hypothetical protein IIC65_08675, partial [Candidatus Sumerlaeota bacterium]|nr:hypothetical protein [Candidatus Sumerlaeota bacterium]